LLALESLNDFNTRSNIDAVRKHTQSILEEDDYPWNEVLFFKTFKSIVDAGDINMCSNVTAELSPDFKKKVVNTIDLVERQQSPRQQQQLLFPLYVPSQTAYSPTMQQSVPFPNSDATNSCNIFQAKPDFPSMISTPPPLHHPKHSPRRRSEHEKWKILPKSIFDKTL
jgi:hypothetical protein